MGLIISAGIIKRHQIKVNIAFLLLLEVDWVNYGAWRCTGQVVLEHTRLSGSQGPLINMKKEVLLGWRGAHFARQSVDVQD